jgi:thiamine-phosphate pyrophosphorylase
MRLYAITDMASLAASPLAAEDALVTLASQWAVAGIDVIQVREKQLAAGALEELSRRIVAAVQVAGNPGHRTRVLINGRPDVAIAAGADGVHLPGSATLTPAEIRRLYADRHVTPPVISVACHSLADIEKARDQGATMALFSPIFGKLFRVENERMGGPANTMQEHDGTPGVGVDALREACRVAGEIPVFALGGIDSQNAQECVAAGAAGVAAIRIFHGPGWRDLMN